MCFFSENSGYVGFGPFLNTSGNSADKLTAASQLPDLPLEMRQDLSDFSWNARSLKYLPASK